MDSKSFRVNGKKMVDMIADYMDNLHLKPVTPAVKPTFLIKALPTEAPSEGEDWEKIVEDLNKLIVPGITNWQHPKFHAYFPAGNSYPSILGDLLGAGLGCNGFSWAASPACTELEMVVMDWLGKLFGLPKRFLHSSGEGGGVIQGSASECVLVAMLIARKRAIDRLVSKYPYMDRSLLLLRMVAYASDLAHSCFEKAVSVCAVHMRQLDTDSKFSLRGSSLRKVMEEDKKMGLIPFFVLGTVGTTSVCSSDSVHELGQVCEEFDTYFHLDCAYAGNALVCPEFSYLISGIRFVDSLNVNPNKWLLVNYDCSCMWVRNRTAIEETFCADPIYLQHEHQQNTVDFRNWGIPLSRRFRSLKLWMVLRTYGAKGLQKYIREHVRLAKLFEKFVRDDNRFELVGSVTFGLVCFRLKGPNKLTEKLLGLVNSSSKLFVVPSKVKQRYIIRFAVCAPDARDSDMARAWAVFSEFANAMLASRVRETSLALEESLPTDVVSNSVGSTDEAAGGGGSNGMEKTNGYRPSLRQFSLDQYTRVARKNLTVRKYRTRSES